MQNCKNSELYLQKFCYVEAAFEVDFEEHVQCTGDEYKPSEVEFEDPVPLRKGSARVAKW